MTGVKSSAILILLMLCGCSGGHFLAPAATGPVGDEPYPIADGVIAVTLGDVREIIAPPGSATAGSRWLATTVTYTNICDRPAWVTGYSEEAPFYGIERRVDAGGPWRNAGPWFCGNGIGNFEIPPGTSHSFQVALPDQFAGQEIRVCLPFQKTPSDRLWVRAVSDAHRLTIPLENGQTPALTAPAQ